MYVCLDRHRQVEMLDCLGIWCECLQRKLIREPPHDTTSLLPLFSAPLYFPRRTRRFNCCIYRWDIALQTALSAVCLHGRLQVYLDQVHICQYNYCTVYVHSVIKTRSTCRKYSEETMGVGSECPPLEWSRYGQGLVNIHKLRKPIKELSRL